MGSEKLTILSNPRKDKNNRGRRKVYSVNLFFHDFRKQYRVGTKRYIKVGDWDRHDIITQDMDLLISASVSWHISRINGFAMQTVWLFENFFFLFADTTK